MSTQLAAINPDQPVGEKIGDVQKFLSAFKTQIVAALPKHLTVDRVIRLTLTAIANSPQIKNCTLRSLLGAVIQASQLGIELGTPLGHGYLVPYKDTCQFILGYRGMIDLAHRSGKVAGISAHVVYERDEFDFEFGLVERLKHTPSQDYPRGKMIAAYAIAYLSNGFKQYELMWATEIESVRDKSASYSWWIKSGKKGRAPIWETNPEEMYKKTVIRRLFKYLPTSIEMATAIIQDEDGELGNQSNAAILNFTNEALELPDKSRTEEVIEEIKK